MRRSRRIAGLLAGATGIGVLALATAARIEPLLPVEGGSVCYAGDFTGDQALTFGWPHEHQTKQAHVTRLTLRLDRRAGQTPHRDGGSGYHFDWRYAFAILMDTSDRGTFRAGGECDWTQGAAALLEWELDCFIDCDGGGIRLSRRPGRQALTVTWDQERWLRMSGCGDGGAILRAGDTAKSFAVAHAAAETCAKSLPAE